MRHCLAVAVNRAIRVALVATAAMLALAAFHPVRAGERAFAPVQYGFQPNAPTVADHVPGRVLVQLTPGAKAASTTARSLRFGQVSRVARFGVGGVDNVLSRVQARALSPAYMEPMNTAEAERLGVGRWYVVEFDPAQSAPDVAAQFAALPDVQAATLDYVAFPAAVPADPLYSIHWGHNNTAQMLSYNWTNNNHETGSPVGTVGFDTNAQVAWDGAQGFGSSSVIIAIIDTGVQAAHPDLVQVAGYDFGDNDTNPDDNSAAAGHGTACAGVAAARNNSLGSVGIAAGCSIMPLKVANSAGTMSFTSIQNALYWAADHGANIISMSLGAAISSDAATDAAILYAYNAGCTILAATGNENASTISYPAINANVIGVGAASPCGDRKRSSSLSSEVNPGVSTDPRGYTCDGERWWGSNYGVTTQNAAGAVDVIAPTILPTTDRLGSAGYDASDYSKWFNGTSCATPYAAGVCALIKSANPSFTPAQVRARLTSTAQDIVNVESVAGWDRYSGYGMVDAAAAVAGSVPVDQATVTYPNGGESLTAGSSVNITWTASGSFTTVNLDYSSDGGSTWTSIAAGTANDGTQAWTVPTTTTTTGRVRVTGGTASDQSNANFSIVTAPVDQVTVTYPNGGESLTAGSSVNITWTSVGSFTTVNLDYSSDGGSTWTSIAAGTANDGTQAWTVPSTTTTTGRVRVTGGTANDQSNANFSIVASTGYAALPYSTGFEGGAFDGYWTTNVTASGRVQLTTANTPHAGSYHMVMDCSVSNNYSTTDANLKLNLAGKSQVNLSFWWKDFGDETQTQDGIYFSSNGGTTYTKVYSLAPASYSNNTWRNVVLDVDALAAANGITLTNTFVIRFQQYDNYPVSGADGMAFDDISVTEPAALPPGISAESEPNDASTTADGPVGTGRAVTGSVSTSTDNDYYYFDVTTAGTVNISLAIGASADLDWFLYNSSLTQVAQGYSTANPEVGTYSAAVGRYYLKVNGYLGATSSYTLTLTGGLANANIPPQKGAAVMSPLLPLVNALLPNAPNPFRAGTVIHFSLAHRTPVNVQVIDANGRHVATLQDGELESGVHQLEWAGRTAGGTAAPAGVYFYRIVTPEFSQTRKMVLIK